MIIEYRDKTDSGATLVFPEGELVEARAAIARPDSGLSMRGNPSYVAGGMMELKVAVRTGTIEQAIEKLKATELPLEPVAHP